MRHVVAGFLVEYLNMDWRLGERWFDYTLVDADTAINAYMWQNGTRDPTGLCPFAPTYPYILHPPTAWHQRSSALHSRAHLHFTHRRWPQRVRSVELRHASRIRGEVVRP